MILCRNCEKPVRRLFFLEGAFAMDFLTILFGETVKDTGAV